MDKKSEEKKHFVLVHGFCHGAWCWYKLVTLLKMNMHEVTALDLGGSGIHPKQFKEIPSMSDYIQPLMDFMSSLPNDEKVILVGHRYGGIPLSLAMENFPQKISLAVFISACMPNSNDPPATVVKEDLELGKMLIRPSMFSLEEMGKNLLTQERYGIVKRGYIICEDDQVMDEEFQRYNIENSPPDEVVAIAGAGHMAMLSKTQHLCFSLQELAQKYS